VCKQSTRAEYAQAEYEEVQAEHEKAQPEHEKAQTEHEKVQAEHEDQYAQVGIHPTCVAFLTRLSHSPANL
jgi:hypothetical protein